jgi:hypothetical protein
MHHEVYSRLRVLIRAATMSPARADGMRRRLAVAVLATDGCLRHEQCSYSKENNQQDDQDEDQDTNTAA